MLGERPELAVGERHPPLADRQLWQPAGVEAGRPEGGAGLLGRGRVGLGQVAGRVQVDVDRLPGDEQLHDLRRALEDTCHAEVAEDLLSGHWTLAAGLQGSGCLIAAAASDLDHLVGDPPGHLGAPELGQRGLQPDVVALLVGQLAGELDHRLHPEGDPGDLSDLLGDGVVLPDRAAPLDPLVGPLADDLETVLGSREADGRQ